MLRTCRSAALVVVGAGALAAGCAAEPAAVAADSREDLCVRLLRDLRLYCKTERDSLGGSPGLTGMDCMSRQLEFRRRCAAPEGR